MLSTSRPNTVCAKRGGKTLKTFLSLTKIIKYKEKTMKKSIFGWEIKVEPP